MFRNAPHTGSKLWVMTAGSDRVTVRAYIMPLPTGLLRGGSFGAASPAPASMAAHLGAGIGPERQEEEEAGQAEAGHGCYQPSRPTHLRPYTADSPLSGRPGRSAPSTTLDPITLR